MPTRTAARSAGLRRARGPRLRAARAAHARPRAPRRATGWRGSLSSTAASSWPRCSFPCRAGRRRAHPALVLRDRRGGGRGGRLGGGPPGALRVRGRGRSRSRCSPPSPRRPSSGAWRTASLEPHGRRRGRRGDGAAVRADPRPALRRGRVPGRPGRGPALRLAAMGRRHLDRPRGDARRGQLPGGDRSDEAMARASRARSALLAAACTFGSSSPKATVVVGAVYPLGGSQGPGGIDEHRGVLLAADLVEPGRRRGRRARSRCARSTPRAPTPRPAPSRRSPTTACDLVLGSYGSTISGPASSRGGGARHALLGDGRGGHAPAGLRPRRPHLPRAADRRGPRARGDRVHRGPGGAVAGTATRPPCATRSPTSTTPTGTRWRAGARAELQARGLHDVGDFGYDFRTVDMRRLVHRIAAAKPDVLFVSAYLDDAIALRRQLVAQHVPLLANIGTSSSYCMPAFGATLGKDAVGVYASDKPSASVDQPLGPAPGGAGAAGARRRRLPRAATDTDMSPAALAGFSGAWALFTDVLPGVALARPGGRGRRGADGGPAAREPAERERPALRRARHARGRRQRRRGERDLGVGLARTRRRDLAARLRHRSRWTPPRRTRGEAPHASRARPGRHASRTRRSPPGRAASPRSRGVPCSTGSARRRPTDG